MAASYTAKDILVLEGLEPVRRRPGMYIGGVDATGLHHLLWEIVDNSVDEAMNGHADRITRHAPQGRRVGHRHRQRPRHPGRPARAVQEAGARADPHHAARRRQVRGQELLPLGRPARRRRVGRDRALREAGRARQARRRRVGADVRARQGDRAAQEARRRARQRHDHLLPPRREDLPEASSFDAEAHRRARSRPRPICTAASPSSSTTRRPARKATLPLRGRPAGLPREDHRRDAASAPLGGEVFAIQQAAGRPPPRLRPRLDRGHHRARAVVRQQHPDHLRRRARERPQGRPREGGPQLPDRPQPRAARPHDHRRGRARGPGRACSSIKIPQPQFQGQTKERLNNAEVTPVIDGIVRTALENALNANRTAGDAIANRVILAARARSASRAAARAGAAQERHLASPEPAGQARRLQLDRPERVRALHRRGRLRRRLGQAGPRSQLPGDPAAARQGAQHRAGVDREGARQQGARPTSSRRSAAAPARTSTPASSATTRSAC